MEFTIFLMLITVLNIALTVSLFIEVKALKNSTHQVTYYNPETQKFEELTDALKDNLTKDPFDNVG